jgi:hypothetical protein
MNSLVCARVPVLQQQLQNLFADLEKTGMEKQASFLQKTLDKKVRRRCTLRCCSFVCFCGSTPFPGLIMVALLSICAVVA